MQRSPLQSSPWPGQICTRLELFPGGSDHEVATLFRGVHPTRSRLGWADRESEGGGEGVQRKLSLPPEKRRCSQGRCNRGDFRRGRVDRSVQSGRAHVSNAGVSQGPEGRHGRGASSCKRQRLEAGAQDTQAQKVLALHALLPLSMVGAASEWLFHLLSPVVRPWTHSAVYLPDFLSPWQAVEVASDLSRELGFAPDCSDDLPFFQWTCWECSFAPPRRHFQEEGPVCDSICLRMTSQVADADYLVPHSALGHWCNKPWTLASTSLASAPDEDWDEVMLMQTCWSLFLTPAVSLVTFSLMILGPWSRFFNHHPVQGALSPMDLPRQASVPDPLCFSTPVRKVWFHRSEHCGPNMTMEFCACTQFGPSQAMLWRTTTSLRSSWLMASCRIIASNRFWKNRWSGVFSGKQICQRHALYHQRRLCHADVLGPYSDLCHRAHFVCTVRVLGRILPLDWTRNIVPGALVQIHAHPPRLHEPMEFVDYIQGLPTFFVDALGMLGESIVPTPVWRFHLLLADGYRGVAESTVPIANVASPSAIADCAFSHWNMELPGSLVYAGLPFPESVVQNFIAYETDFEGVPCLIEVVCDESLGLPAPPQVAVFVSSVCTLQQLVSATNALWIFELVGVSITVSDGFITYDSDDRFRPRAGAFFSINVRAETSDGSSLLQLSQSLRKRLGDAPDQKDSRRALTSAPFLNDSRKHPIYKIPGPVELHS